MERQSKLLICKKCGGSLEIDTTNNMLFCPYCGSKEIYFENDPVIIERIRANTYREVESKRMDVESQRLDQELELKRIEKEREMKNNKYMMLLILIVIAFVIFLRLR